MDLKKVSLVYAAGVHESRGRLHGLLFGSGAGLLFGGCRGTSQSRLFKAQSPPKKLPYAAPTILWLLGFFILMGFDGRGKLSWMMGILSVTYLLLLPFFLFGVLFYNLFVRPKRERAWESQFVCQRYGALTSGE
jgi:hypothetical protein